MRNQSLNRTKVLQIVSLIILAFFLPLMSVFLLLASIYKIVCAVIIRHKDKKFVKFLDSFDVFWCLEDDTSKNIINVVGLIESETSEILVENIKNKLKNKIPCNKSDDTEKIFYRRSEEYGFYYWTRHTSIDLDEYVKVVEVTLESNDINKESLEEIMTEISYKSLPYDNKGLFQIIVIKHNISFDDKRKHDFGIIFRIHHSIGDGFALIKFLCKTLADESEAKTLNMFSTPELYESNKCTSIYDLLGMMRKLCDIPICFINGIIRETDNNSLHGPPLLGKKYFKWTNSDENLLVMIKEIKKNIDGVHFSDVLAMALSNGLQDFFLKVSTVCHLLKITNLFE